MNILVKILNYPIVQHFFSGGLVVVLLWRFSIVPLQSQNSELRNDLQEISVRQHELIKKLSEKDTYKIENKVDGVKIKKGGEIRLIPDSKMELSSNETNANVEEKDTTSYRKHWWQLWKKRNKPINNLNK